jgi:hypothetical protein
MSVLLTVLESPVFKEEANLVGTVHEVFIAHLKAKQNSPCP